MRAHTWLFECTLDAAYPAPLWLRIQVFDDGTMTAAIDAPPTKQPSRAAHERLVFGQSAGFQFYAMDGSATWQDVDGNNQDPRCRCTFKLVRFSKRLREGRLIECEAYLLPRSHNDSASGSRLCMRSAGTVRRRRRVSPQDLELPATCELRLIQQRVTPSIAPLVWKLTPGKFVFSGFTCAVSEILYDCKLTLTLDANGFVTGFSEDQVNSFTRKSPLQGHWSSDCVSFQLTDSATDIAHVFVYSLVPHPSGLRGTWHEQLTQKRGYFQEGHVELTALSVTREGTWTPELHDSYPLEFQEVAKQCTDLNQGNHDAKEKPKLPQDLWDTVLTNCAYDWF